MPASPDPAILDFFHRDSGLIALFLTLQAILSKRYPHLEQRIDKTQITFLARHMVCCVWLPLHQVQGRPEKYLLLSFGLDRKIDDPRFLEVAEPYPKRFMHHLLLSKPEDLDGQLLDWLDEAERFAQR